MSITGKPAEIIKLKSDVEHLYKTVYQGNGKPSILNQITSIEHRLDSLEEKLDSSFKSMDTEMSLKFDNITDIVNERFNHISYQISHEFENDKVTAAGRHQLRAGVITAVIATVTTFAALIINHILATH
jgi:coproporphyrinogen III oxidase-like Fe-S oxidoreductase